MPVPVPTPVRVPIQIRWRDLDALGHVNNAVFISYFEHARLAYIHDLLGPDAKTDRQTMLPVDFQIILAEVSCQYRSPVNTRRQASRGNLGFESGAEKLRLRIPYDGRTDRPPARRRVQHAGVVRLPDRDEPGNT